MKYIISFVIIALFIGGCASAQGQQYSSLDSDFNVIEKKIIKPNPNHLNYDTPTIKYVRNADYAGSHPIKTYIFQDLNSVIVALADQLLVTNGINNKKKSQNKIMLTSFVDLNQFNKTTVFGRLVSESMFNELYIRKFKVADIRGQNAVSINANGEFHITRDIKKLKKHIEGINYILVGTYVKFENNSLLLNARILDSLNGDVISSARIVYKPRDCKIFNICQDEPQEEFSPGIDIVTDYCSQVGCPEQNCENGICEITPTF
jgi:TolB-like protein